MKSNRGFTLSAAVWIVSLATLAGAELSADMHLWYARPAGIWTEALPIGNGRLGAMVFGGVRSERIQLNEDSVWAGPPVPPTRPGFKDAMTEARGLWFAGRYAEAQQLVQAQMSPRISPRSHQTLGDLHLDMAGADSEVEGYRRELDLDSGVAATVFTLDGTTYRREAYCSGPDQVMVVRLTADREHRISVRARLDRPDAFVLGPHGEDTLVMQGQAQHEGKHLGATWQVRLQAMADGGSIRIDGDELVVVGANSLTLLVAASTDFNRTHPDSPLDRDLGVYCASTLAAAAAQGPERLQSTAVGAHREQFRRCILDLGGSEKGSVPTDQRIEAMKRGDSDPALLALLFHFGRYLLMGSSQPGAMPANLQGLWNDNLEAPWNADYHININLQMNYWLAQVANLAECQEPYFRFVEALVPSAKRSARENYGCRGAVAHHTTDAWLHTNPFGAVGYGMFPHGFGWCTRQFMDAYRFNGDVAFLAEHAYPVLKEAALFYLDYLVEHPDSGELVSGLDNSPENAYRTAGGETAHISMGPAMSQQIIWDVFNNVLEAAAVLGRDDAFTREVRAAFGKLKHATIGDDGRLMEWALPFEEPEPGHRHMSHLYALHPGAQYNVHASPDMVEAARKSITYRLEHGGGHTGWSRAWMINFWARFHDAEHAHGSLEALVRRSMLPNLFDHHPPFQIDGNFGAAAGMAEMLVQSHVQMNPPRGPYLIELLPALPDAWPVGEIRGLRARGGFELDLAWRDGTLDRVALRSIAGNPCVLAYGGTRIRLDTTAGETRDLEPTMFRTDKGHHHE